MFKARIIRKGDASGRLALMKSNARVLKQGIEAQAGFPQGTEEGIAQIAFYNEFGTQSIPARPFMREGFRGAKGTLRAIAHADAKKVLRGDMEVELAVRRLGNEAVEAIGDSIVLGSFTPNAPSTVRQKGSSRPLVDIGTMKDAVHLRIKKGGRR